MSTSQTTRRQALRYAAHIVNIRHRKAVGVEPLRLRQRDFRLSAQRLALRVMSARRLVPMDDAVESDSGVPQSREHADDEQVGQGERLGLEKVVEEWQVQAGELEAKRRRYGCGKPRIGEGPRADPGPGSDRELGHPEREERHALPGPACGVAPDSDTEGDGRDHYADADDALP